MFGSKEKPNAITFKHLISGDILVIEPDNKHTKGWSNYRRDLQDQKRFEGYVEESCDMEDEAYRFYELYVRERNMVQDLMKTMRLIDKVFGVNGEKLEKEAVWAAHQAIKSGKLTIEEPERGYFASVSDLGAQCHSGNYLEVMTACGMQILDQDE